MSSTRDVRTHQLHTWVPPILLGLLTAGAYAQFMGDYFQGGDTWPHIWTSRVSSVADLLRDLTRPILYGTIFPDNVALFFRPVSTLSYALDYAVWGMNALAFHVTDLVIHTIATLSLFALARLLGLRTWPAAIGAAAFTLHPIMASVVPVLPRRHDSLAAACVFSALAVATWAIQLPPADRRAVTAILAAGALLGLGELAKESAFVGLLLAPPTLIAGMLVRDCPSTSQWRRLGAATLVLCLVTIAVFGWRFAVLGGIGGYYDQVPPLARLDIALTNLLENLLWPFRAVLGRTPRAWLTEIGLAVVLTGAAAVLGRRDTRVPIVYGWVWLVLCGLAQMLTKSVAAWQSYLTVGGFAFLVGGVLQAAIDVTRPRVGVMRRTLTLASAFGVGTFVLALIYQSVVFTRYDDWRVAGEVAREYLVTIRPCLEATPGGESVMLNQYPGGLDDSTDQRKLIAPGIFGPYSLAPAIYLTLSPPPPAVNISTLQMVLPGLPQDMTAVCHDVDGTWWIRTDYAN